CFTSFLRRQLSCHATQSTISHRRRNADRHHTSRFFLLLSFSSSSPSPPCPSSVSPPLLSSSLCSSLSSPVAVSATFRFVHPPLCTHTSRSAVSHVGKSLVLSI